MGVDDRTGMRRAVSKVMGRVASVWLGAACLVTWLSGCASPVEPEQRADSTSALGGEPFEDEFISRVRLVESKRESCAHGDCGEGTATASLSELHVLTAPSLSSDKSRSITSFHACEVLRPLAGVQHPYFFAGTEAHAGDVGVTAAGVDLVFDLSNRQAAYFTYQHVGIQNLVGVGASVYTGLAFGKHDNVLEAWSGTFQTAQATVATPFLNIAVGGTIFRSPDNTLWGGAVQASLGFNLIPTAVEAGVSEGEWTAWDGATKSLADSYWFVVSREVASAKVGSHTHEYVQFSGSFDISVALLETFGVAGSLPAAIAVGLDVLKKRNLTIEAACP